MAREALVIWKSIAPTLITTTNLRHLQPAKTGSEHFHLIALGMMMLSPPVVSLPVKVLLFVMVDGWALVCGGVAASFR